MKQFLFSITLVLFIISCKQKEKNKSGDTSTVGNKCVTISTDTAELGNIINIKTFKPTHTKFKYTFIDNSGQEKRLSVPGPSDYYLEAVLYFDSLVFKDLEKRYFSADYVSPNYDKKDFNFNWLNTEIERELLNSDTSYHGHPDYFFRLGSYGKMWFLKNKILLTKHT